MAFPKVAPAMPCVALALFVALPSALVMPPKLVRCLSRFCLCDRPSVFCVPLGNGVSPQCPPDNASSASTVCRAAVDACDQTEYCNGASTSCPADQKVAAGTVCRNALSACDISETCNGVSNACPADSFRSSSQICRFVVPFESCLFRCIL